jgi:uncharacterized phage protein (TIGR01671 family)
MREILFRIWHKTHQKMYENIYEINFYNSRVGYIIDDYSAMEQRIEDVLFDDCIIMQFTGLTDKNGTKIFEGDRLHCWGGEYWMGVWEFDEIIEVDDIRNLDYISKYEHIEVIENIHERGNNE